MEGSQVIILSLIGILSLFAVSDEVFAESHNITPISVSTELSTYGNGEIILVSGNIKDYDSSSGGSLTYIIKSPENNLVTHGQLTPSSDGSFELSFIAGGPLWKSNGDYIVEFHFGTISGETKFVFTGGDLDVTPVICASNEELVNGVCVLKESKPQLTIPNEFKEIAAMWVQDEITNDEFLQSIQIRINQERIILPDVDTAGTGGADSNIPSWIKDTMSYWVSNQVEDVNVGQAIQQLFKSDILPVSIDSKLDASLLPPKINYKDQNSNNEISFSGAIGSLINCETFSYDVFLHSKSPVTLVEIIDPNGNVAGSSNGGGNIEMNWGVAGTYLIQVHYKGEIYQEDFSYGKLSPENYQGHRMGCLRQEYVESIRNETWEWFNWPDHTHKDFNKNIKTAEELTRESNEPFWLSFVSEENINNMIQGEPPVHDTSTSFSKRNELKLILSDGVEQKVIKIFQDSENKLLDVQNISLDQKIDLIFELRAERDQQVINQKAYAEEYVENLYRLYSSVKASQDYMTQYTELVNQITLQEKEKELQIAKEKDAIKHEILSKEEIIPQWIKSNAKWWSEDQIDDETFVSGIQFLMKEKIVNIPDLTEQVSEKARPSFVDESKDPQRYIDRYNNEENYKEWFDENYPDYTIYEAVGVTEPVPRWVKNNADWWSQGLITEDEFIKGIEFLVEKGIIQVPIVQELQNEITQLKTENAESEQPPPNISIANPRVVDAFGNELDTVSVGQQTQISIDITNYNHFKQPFNYHITIKGTEYEESISGLLSGGQSYSPALTWIPTKAGIFTAELSVFDNIQNENKLTDSITLQIRVS